MGTYMTALLSGRFLDPATYRLMWTSKPSPQYGADPPSDASRGLGWDLVIEKGARAVKVEKGGSVPGFVSELILCPASDSGVFVSINTNSAGSRHPNQISALHVAESLYAATRPGSPAKG
jgi:hypothetical protein